MTSGNFKSIPLDQITVNRPERQRKNLAKIDTLAASIRQSGLINPIVVDDNLCLVAGERRLTACRLIGWTSIPVQFASDMSADQLYLIELEENVSRVDLTWQEQCTSLLHYHQMQSDLNDDWNASRTAECLHISKNELAQRMFVAKDLEAGDPMVVNADKYSVARGISLRKRARKADESKDSMDGMLSPSSNINAAPTPREAATGEDIPVPELDLPEIVVPYLHASFLEWAKDYSGERFNFLHCDFPYGVNANKHAQGAGKAFGTYEDGEDVYWNLLDGLAEAMPRVVADSAHMMFWFSMDHYETTRERLTRMGWSVNIFPLLWYKSDNSGILPDPSRGPRRNYETAFLCSRGDRFVVQAVSNVAAAPNVKTIHMSEKNPDMLRHFFRMFVDESTSMLDPTMGSGNAVWCAEDMGANRVLGLEMEKTFFEEAKRKYLDRSS